MTRADETAPGAPTVVISEDGNNDGELSNSEISGDTDITIGLPSGAVENDVLNVTIDGVTSNVTLTAAMIAAGEYTTSVTTPAEGEALNVSATLTDQANNTSLSGSDSVTRLDETAPGSPTVTITEDSNNDGELVNAEISGNTDITIDLPATAVAGDTLNVTIDGTTTPVTLTAAMITATQYVISVATPAEGVTLNVSASITDQAGNTSASDADSVTRADETATGAPTVVISEDGNNDGELVNAEISGNTDITIALPATAVAGDTLNVTIDSTTTPVILTPAMITATEYVTSVATPAEGVTLNVSATITDQAGNTSASDADSVTRADETAPGAPTVTITEDTNNDGALVNAEISGNTDITIDLPATAVADDTLNVTIDGTTTAVILTAAMITATQYVTSVATPAEGVTLNVSASITDQAGNTSASDADSVTRADETVDQDITGGDTSGILTEDTDSDVGNDEVDIQLELEGSLTINHGLFNPTATFTSSTNTAGTQLGALVTDAAGNWSYEVDNALVQFLDADETIVETYTVTTADGKDSQTISITINGVDDVPTVDVANNIINISTNSTHELSTADFSFSDVDGSDELASITVTSLPTDGELKHFDGTDWNTVILEQVISATDIENGYLVFLPATDETNITGTTTSASEETATDIYSVFGFTVSDGTSSSAQATITYSVNNVLSVSDPSPVDEGSSVAFVIQLSAARTVDTVLDLSTGGDATAVDDYETPLQYRMQNSDGSYSDWTDVTGNQITITQGLTKAEVKVKTETDIVSDEAESLTLTASINGYSENDMANISATGETSINDKPSLQVEAPSYISEGNTGIFEISLSDVKNTDTEVTISFKGAAILGTDFEYSIDGGITWISSASSTITIPGDDDYSQGFDVYVRTDSDGNSESDEKIILIATTTDSGIANNGEEVDGSSYIVEGVEITINEDQAASAVLSDDTTYTYKILGQPENGTLSDSGGVISYTPNANFSGTDSFAYSKTNVVGQTVTGIATVNVSAVADAPTISITIGEATNGDVSEDASEKITNGDFSNYTSASGNGGSAVDAALDGWTITASTGNIDIELIDDAAHLSGDKKKSFTLDQTLDLVAGEEYTLTFEYGLADSGATATMEVEVNGTVESTYTETDTGANTGTYVGSITFTAVGGGSDVISFAGKENNDTGQGDGFGMLLDNVSVVETPVQYYNYNIDIDVALTDTDGSESLQDILISSSDVPADAVLTLEDGSEVTKVVNGSTYEWLVTEANLSGLVLTTATPGEAFTLTAAVTSAEMSDGNIIATSTAATDTDTASTVIPVSTDDAPTIGNSEILISNESGFDSGTLTNSIPTYFSIDAPNTFSWNEDKTVFPNMVVNGQTVELTFDDAAGTVIGSIDNGTTTVFTVTIVLDETNGQTSVSYSQNADLISVEETVDGGIVLPGGGNGDSLVLTFNDAGGSVALDAVLTSENTLDGTSDNTVNTNNYYIGVDSNNMNAGDKLTMDFAASGAVYEDGSGTSSANSVSKMTISLFNFDSNTSRSNPDELTITITDIEGTVDVLNIVNSDLSADNLYTITASSGLPISKLVFEGGSSSSFKLGVESISSITSEVDFDMVLSYNVTDVDGDTDSGLVTITLDGDDLFIYDSSAARIDAGDGYDTLLLEANEMINFAVLDDDRVKNFEVINLNLDDDDGNTAHTLSGMTLADVVGLTDSDNELKIMGDAADKVELAWDGSGNNWTSNSTVTEDSVTFNVYTHADDVSVTLKVEEGVEVSTDSLVLTAGAGEDTFTGGDGADTFIWQSADNTVSDHISNFNATEDTLDLSDLLNVELGDNLNDFLNFTSDGTNTTIDIFADGDASDAGTPSQTIVLDGVNLGSDDVTVINALFEPDNSGALIISDSSEINQSVEILDIPE
ncbi:type I secretion C-terminal target domain-containing protein [Psychromonas sp.]|uniref:type I secretion C-terminal target domain-containing protein n=1 Tax=Psychromonas sp. TaxID=1884585 RepID=UPI003564F190